MGWFKGNHRLGVGNDTMHRPGDKPPNDFGIHDMHGNLAEWCRDWYHEDFYKESVGARDPLCENSLSVHRVIRGGDWNDPTEACRSPSRNKNIPAHRRYDLGFRPTWSSP